jgi:hypothetical protein
VAAVLCLVGLCWFVWTQRRPPPVEEPVATHTARTGFQP